jgi:hypothetical protein
VLLLVAAAWSLGFTFSSFLTVTGPCGPRSLGLPAPERSSGRTLDLCEIIRRPAGTNGTPATTSRRSPVG